MCLIIDTNVVARVFSSEKDPDFGKLHHSLFLGGNPSVRIVYGGKLGREYLKVSLVTRLLLLLDRAGRARKIPNQAVNTEEMRITKLKICKSDDPHVIALARISGVRLLCSHDRALHKDFRNKKLLDKPRGRVYQDDGHRQLLMEACVTDS